MCVCVCVCVCVLIVHIPIQSLLSRVVVWIVEGTLQGRKPLFCRIYLFKEGCSVPHGNRHWPLIAEHPT
jgi:hypothetical protein